MGGDGDDPVAPLDTSRAHGGGHLGDASTQLSPRHVADFGVALAHLGQGNLAVFLVQGGALAGGGVARSATP